MSVAAVQSVPKTTACPRRDGSIVWRSSSDSITSVFSVLGSSDGVVLGGLERVFLRGMVLGASSFRVCQLAAATAKVRRYGGVRPSHRI
jgi:hypothetical protein